MSLRAALAVLIMVATATFVVAVAIERGQESGHQEQGASEAGEAHSASGELGEPHAETEDVAERRSAEASEELRPLGVDVEAWPFVVTAAAASLALAGAALARPRAVALLALVGVAMLVFSALDVREVLHQVDENDGDLAVLAGVVAALHLAAAGVAAAMAPNASA